MTNSPAIAEEHGAVRHLAEQDWGRIAAELDARGCAVLPAILSREECAALACSYC